MTDFALPITALFAGFCGLWLACLSLRVIFVRRSARISLGDGGNADLERRVRAQGNAAEYMPIGLILIAMGEINGIHGAALLIVGGVFMLGRLMHGWAFSFTNGSMVARVLGMHLTLWPIMGLAIWNVYLAIPMMFG